MKGWSKIGKRCSKTEKAHSKERDVLKKLCKSAIALHMHAHCMHVSECFSHAPSQTTHWQISQNQ